MQVQITKWENSLGIRIPKWAAEKAGLTEGVPVILEIANDTIIIRRKKKYDLKTLLSQITSQNIHSEVDTGYPARKELG